MEIDEQNPQNFNGIMRPEENEDDLIDEFINVIGELDAEMNMRQLDLDEEDVEEGNDGLVAVMEQGLRDLDFRRPVIALDVSFFICFFCFFVICHCPGGTLFCLSSESSCDTSNAITGRRKSKSLNPCSITNTWKGRNIPAGMCKIQ
jgi:hypothetical protein